MGTVGNATSREPWNKGKSSGRRRPSRLKDIWALRVRLQMDRRVRELALFNLGIDSKLRGCDLIALKVRDVCHGDQVATRGIVLQHKTQRPVQFEITQATRDALQAWIKQRAEAGGLPVSQPVPRLTPHLGTRQYARILGHWVDTLGLDRAEYGTHSMRRTKATLIYRRTKSRRRSQTAEVLPPSPARWSSRTRLAAVLLGADSHSRPQPVLHDAHENLALT